MIFVIYCQLAFPFFFLRIHQISDLDQSNLEFFYRRGEHPFDNDCLVFFSFPFFLGNTSGIKPKSI